MIVDYINGRQVQSYYGTAKYSHEISRRFPPGLLNRIEYPLVYSSRLVDGFTRRYLYPSIVKRKQNPDHIHHITNQDLAFLLTKMELSRTVVTCYDLIPWVYYRNRSRYWKRNIEGLRKADRIITISKFSKEDIIRNAGVPADRIDVIYCGVDRNVFYPRRDRTALDTLGIQPDARVLLYVGSEEPRKNLAVVLEAVSLVRKEIPTIMLLKVGSPGMSGSRKLITQLITKFHLEDRVFFSGDISEEMLAKYYNASDLFIFPSLYEGFGLPIIEAMACGCPVIASNTTSIPEVVGDAGILVEPDDLHKITQSIIEILIKEEKRDFLIERGFSRVIQFDWEEAKRNTIRVYERL